MMKDLAFIANECCKIMYILTDNHVPAIVAREIGLMYRQRYERTKELLTFDQFLLETTYKWVIEKDLDWEKYTNWPRK